MSPIRDAARPGLDNTRSANRKKTKDPARRLKKWRPVLAVELLEDRLTPANLDVSATGVASLIANPGELNDISLFLNLGTARYEFTDNGAPITVSGAGAGPAGADVQGAGTNMVTGKASFLTSITIDTGDLADFVTIRSTAVPTSVTTTGTGADNDTVTIGNAGSVQDITGPVNVTNVNALTSLLVDDSADPTARTVTMSDTTIHGLAPADITYDPAAISDLTVNGGGGGNIWNVNSTIFGSPTTINGGGGVDTFNIAASGLGVGSVNNMNGGAGNDVFNVTNTLAGGAVLNIDGQASTTPGDTLAGPNATNTWNVTGANAGNLGGAGAITFTNVENLTGGTGADTFVFAAGGSVAGTIDGGAGVDALDYSALTTPVAVNLGSNTASLTASLDSDQEVPPHTTTPTGTGTITYNNVAHTFAITLSVTGISPTDPQLRFHIHRAPTGVNGPIIVSLFDAPAMTSAGTLTPTGPTSFTFTATGVPLNPLDEAAFLGGITYLNVHDTAFPGGEIRGQVFPGGAFVAASGTATGTGGVSNIENATGGMGGDSLVGSTGASPAQDNVLRGGPGNDVIVGARGNDTMQGEANDDILVWSNGDGSDVMDGGTGNDLVNVNGNVTGDDFFTVAASATPGRVNFQRVAPSAPFTLDIGTTETLTVNGVGGNDTFTVNSLTGVADLGTINFNGFDGNDTFNVHSDAAVTINVTGHLPRTAPGDTLNFDAQGLAVTDNGSQFTQPGRQPVNYKQVETINTANTTSGVTVLGTGGNDILVVTATGPDSGSYSLNGGPPVAFSGITSFTFNALGGNDTFIINNPAGGLFAPSGGIFYDGGPQSGGFGDQLQIRGGLAGTGNFVYKGSNANGHDGTIAYVNGATTANYTYTGLEPILTSVGTADLSFDLTQTGVQNPDVVLSDDGGAGDPDATQDPGFSALHGSTFEYTEFANPTNSLTVQLSDNGDTITTQDMDASFAPAGVGVVDPVTIKGGAGSDTYNIQSTQDVGGGTYTSASGFGLRVLNQSTLPNFGTANVGSAADGVQHIGSVLNIESPPGPGFIVITIDDQADTTGRTATLSTFLPDVDGDHPGGGNPHPYGKINGLAPADINYEYEDTGAITINGGSGGNTFNVQATGVLFADPSRATTINTGSGGDTVNVSSDAPTNLGDLSGIAGELHLNTQGGTDTVNVSDLSASPGQTYSLTQAAGATTLSTTHTANIVYDANGTAGQLEFFNLTGSSSSGNVYNINDTTATDTTTIGDGIAGQSGDSTWNINANNLSANNLFQGFDGNDQFILNINNVGSPNIGGNAAFAIQSLQIQGNDNLPGLPGDTVNRDRLIINDASPGIRALNYQYPGTQGDLNIKAGNANVGLFGPASGGGLSLPVRSMETVIFNDTSGSNNDVDRFFGTAGNDELTVALLPTTAPNATLTNGTQADHSVEVFLGGTPYLAAPPVTIANSRPGVAGGGSGPDLLINGIANSGFQNGIVVDGAGSTGATGQGDQLIVYAASEDDLVDVGNPTDIFGFGAGVLQPGFGVGGAYDTINVTDAVVSTSNNSQGPLVRVNVTTASFVQGAPHTASEQAALIVDGGDEALPQANNIADNITATISSNFNIQVNGNLPELTLAPVTGERQGDQLTIVGTAGPINVFSDGACPPNVTVTSGVFNQFGIRYSSIERLTVSAAPTGVVNLIGDNNDPAVTQNDYFKVRGRDVDGDGEGVNEFALQIGGNWDPATGAVCLSAPIFFNNVTRINVSGGNAIGFDVNGNAIPEEMGTGVDCLDITPYADNTPRGWGIETYFDEGDPVIDGGTPSADLLTYVGVSGVSEDIVIQPSASQAGQLFVNNAATHTPIAVINYLLNTDIIVNGSSPAGTFGDTDNLFLKGTDPANPGTSGNDNFDIDLTRAGIAGDELVRVTDAVGGAPLYNIENFTNFNTLNIDTLGGGDSTSLIGRNDGSVALNVTSHNVQSSVVFPGTIDAADFFQVFADPNGGTDVLAQRAAAGSQTHTTIRGVGSLNLDGGGGLASDVLEVFGTTASDVFAVTPTSALSGFIAVGTLPTINYFSLGLLTSQVILIGDALGVQPGELDSIRFTGTAVADTYAYTAYATDSGNLALTTGGFTANFNVVHFGSLSVDARTPAPPVGVDTLNVTTVHAVITPGSTPGSGTVDPVDINGQPLLSLSYQNFESAIVTGGTAVIEGTAANDTIHVDGNGVVTVTNPLGFNNTVDVHTFTTLVINALGGDDAITIDPSIPSRTFLGFPGGITVIGGEPGAGSDSLTINTTAASPNAVVDFSVNQVTGVVAGPISLNGIENLIINGLDAVINTFSVLAYGSLTDVKHLTLNGGDLDNNDGDHINVNGTPGQDTIYYTPTSASSATLTRSQGAPVLDIVNFNNAIGGGNIANLLVFGFGGIVDSFHFVGSEADDAIIASHDTAIGATLTDTVLGVAFVPVTVPGFESINIHGNAGNDSLTVDNSMGLVFPEGNIFYDGGTGRDSLTLTGTTAVDSDTYNVGPSAGAGSDVQTLGGASQTVFFANLEPVFDSVAGPLVVNATNADNAINYTVGKDSPANFFANVINPAWGEVSVDGFEPIEFTNKTTLTINGLAGSDTINLDNLETPTGLTGVTVNGGDPVGSDQLVVSGLFGGSLVNFAPTTSTMGSVSVSGLPLTTYTTIESVLYVGRSGGDSLIVTAPLGGSEITFVPGATQDSGFVTQHGFLAATALTPFEFRNLGTLGKLTFDTAGGTRSSGLDIHGTASDDRFDVNAAGGVQVRKLNFPAPVTPFINTPGVAVLRLLGLAGDDTFNIPGNHPFPVGIVVQGGDPSASDVLNFTGSGGAVTIDLAAQTVTEAGFAPVVFTGVEVLNVDAGAGAITVLGTTSDDDVTVSPTGATTATLTAAGLNLTIHTTNTGALNVDLLAGSDTLHVNAPNSSDAIGVDVSGATGTVTITTPVPVTLKVLNFPTASTERLEVFGNDGSDTFTVTPGSVPVFIDGGDPIGVMPGDKLIVVGASVFFPGPEGDEGGFLAGPNQPVSFDHIEMIGAITPPPGCPVVIFGTNGDDDITVIARDASYTAPVITPGLDGINDFTVSVNGGPEILFIDAPILAIDGLAGDDDIVIRAPAPNGAAWNETVTVIGGPPSALNNTLGDKLEVETPGPVGQTAVWTPTSSDTGNLHITNTGGGLLVADITVQSTPFIPPPGCPPFGPPFMGGNGGIEELIYDGEANVQPPTPANNDLLRIVGTAGNDTIVANPGAGRDEGDLRVNELLGIKYQNLGLAAAGAAVDVVGNGVAVGGADTLVVNGTAANDTFTVTAVTGTVTLNNRLPLTKTAVANLVLNGYAGDDTFTIPGNHSYANVAVNGGDPSASDVLNFNGTGAGLVTVNYQTSTVQETGFGPVSLTGVELLNADAGGNGLTVLGTAGPDNITYTPTGISAGTVVLEGAIPVVHFTNVVGAFTIDPLGGSNAVTVNGTASNDTITAASAGANTTVQVNVLKSVTLVNADTQALVVAGGLGNDNLIVNSTTGPVLIPITYDGGAGTNALTLTGGIATSDTYTPGSQLGSGTETLVFAALTELIHFLNLAPIFDLVAGPLVVNATNADNAINYKVGSNNLANFLAGVINPAWGEVSVDGFEPMEFINKTTLTINGLAGSDTIDLDNLGTPTGLTGVTVNGGDPTDSDKLIVNGLFGGSTVNFAPTAADMGTISVSALPLTTYTTIESVLYVGRSGGDLLTVTAPFGGSEITFVPGATQDSGFVTQHGFIPATALTPFEFRNLGTLGQLTFDTAPGGVTSSGLDIHGTANDDQFNVNAAGGVLIVKPNLGVPITPFINTPGVAVLRLIGLEGDDIFNIPGNHPFPSGINVQGGDPSASDVLNFTGSGGAVTVDLAAQTVIEAAVFAPVSFTGVEVLNVDAGAGVILVLATTSNDDVTVSPTGANTATLTAAGLNLTIHTTNTGALNVDLLAGSDNLRVNGTQSAETITVTPALVTVGALKTVNYLGVENLQVFGLAGSDTFNVTPSATTTIFIDGGDPIGIVPGDHLNVIGASVFFPGPENDEGGFQTMGAQDVSFDHIESITVLPPVVVPPGGPCPIVIFGTNGDDDITVIARDASYTAPVITPGLDGINDFTVSVNGGPEILFIDAPVLAIDGLAGDDDIIIRAPAPNGAAWNEQVTVIGGPPASPNNTLGDKLEVETPSPAQTAVFMPTGSDTGILNITNTVGGLLVANIIIQNTPFIPPPGCPPIGPPFMGGNGGIEELIYNGQSGGDNLSVVPSTVPLNVITLTPGPDRDSGLIESNSTTGVSLLAIHYLQLGGALVAPVAPPALPATTANTITLGPATTVVYNGTTANDTFEVSPGGAVTLVSTPNNAVSTYVTVVPNAANLRLNGLAGDDTFNIYATQPYATILVNGQEPSGSDVLNLVGTAGNDTLGVHFFATPGLPSLPLVDGFPVPITVTGLGSTIGVTGVETVNIDGNGGAADTLTATGVANQDDTFTYNPTAPTAGIFTNGGFNTTFTFQNITGTFTLAGSPVVAGDDLGDQVIVNGTNNSDFILVDSPNRNVTVENAAGTDLKPVTLAGTVESLQVNGRLGTDTFYVVPAPATAMDTGGGSTAVTVPINLQIDIMGGPVPGQDELVVGNFALGAGPNPVFTGVSTPLPDADFVVHFVGNVTATGVIRVYNNAVVAGAITQFPDITYHNVQYQAVLQNANATIDGIANQPRLLDLGPDTFDPNESVINASFLGTGSAINAPHEAIFPNVLEHRFAPADLDFYRFVAQTTGTLDFQVYFHLYPGMLPAGGNLNVRVLDSAGNIVATGAPAVFGAVGATGNARIRIPIVQGQTYYLEVFGANANGTANGNVINGYSMTVVNTAPPVPTSIELSRSVPNGEPNTPLTTQGTPDTGDLPANAPPSDSGRSQFDDVTNGGHTTSTPLGAATLAKPTIYVRLDDAFFLQDIPGNQTPGGVSFPGSAIPITFNTSTTIVPTGAGNFRIALFDGGNGAMSVLPGTPVNPSTGHTLDANDSTFIGFAQPVPGVPHLYVLTIGSQGGPTGGGVGALATDTLADGVHNISARVQIIEPLGTPNTNNPIQTAWGVRSDPLQITIDTVPPPIAFGTNNTLGNGLAPESDTGVVAEAETFSDRITSNSVPTFVGLAEANSVVRVFADIDGNPATTADDIFLGETVAIPLDGTNAFPNGQWSLRTTVDLNNPAFFPVADGVRHILATAEDLAGNVSAAITFDLFLQTSGPMVTNVQIAGVPGFNLFAQKGSGIAEAQGPTPLVRSLKISIQSLPPRVAGFLFNAFKLPIAAIPGGIILRGDNAGLIPIESITVMQNPVVAGQPATGMVTLNFFTPLPDDRFTLTVFDTAIVSVSGVPLFGTSNASQPFAFPLFPSGNGSPADFIARFTVNSRPHIATACCGSQYVDINGNGVFDPVNKDDDQTNKDLVFNFGLSSDSIFAGQFTPAGTNPAVPQFDKMGAYGQVNGVFRWLLDFNSDGVPDLNVPSGLQLNGLPVAGHFNPALPNVSEIALFDGNGNWFIDFNHTNNLTAGSLVIHDGLSGFPIVGDFDGNGTLDLATYRPDQDTFFFDLNPPQLGGGPHTFPTIHFGFVGVNERPVAADMDKDGTTDVGLWVPNRNGATPSDTAEWYWLISGNVNGLRPPVAGTVSTLNHKFSPAPLGTDIFYKFGGVLAVPLVGLFDPPPSAGVGGSGSGANGATAPNAAGLAPGHHKKHRKVKHAKHPKHRKHVKHPAHTKTTHRHRASHRASHLQRKEEQQALQPALGGLTIPQLPGTEL